MAYNGFRTPSIDKRLDAELVAFHEHIFPTPSATAWRLSTFRHFKKLVRSSWPSVGVHPYGSFATGLFLPESDMDVVICGSSVPDISIQHLLAVLERQLSLSDFVRSSSVIPNARVPLVKFTTTPAFGGFAFDVSFNEQSGLRGTKHVRRLLKQAGEAEQRVPRLILLVKFWLRRKGLMGVPKGGMGGLLVVCMVVSFFQLRGYGMRDSSPGKDLRMFLVYYAEEFNYARHAISTRNGGQLLPKSTYGWSFRSNSDQLVIQDPTDPTRDLAAGSDRFHLVKSTFDRAACVLQVYADPRRPFPPSLLGAIGMLTGEAEPPEIVPLAARVVLFLLFLWWLFWGPKN